MTQIRKFAVGLSGFVARHASAGSREWAEGLAREVEFIDADWKALGWAVSSLPVLLDRRAAPLRSLQDVPALAQKLDAARHSMDGIPGWFRAVAPGIWAALLGGHLLRATCLTERIGYGLAICGWIVFGVALYVDRSRRKERLASPAGDWTLFYTGDVREWVLYYKSELEIQLERQKSPFIWIYVFALIVVCVGLSISNGPHVLSTKLMVPIELGIVPLVLYSRNKIQRRLDRLNLLLAASMEDEI